MVIALYSEPNCDCHHGQDKGKKNHSSDEAAGKGADVGPVKHELAVKVVLLLHWHKALWICTFVRKQFVICTYMLSMCSDQIILYDLGRPVYASDSMLQSAKVCEIQVAELILPTAVLHALRM